jgi:hypothetical protein
MGRWLQVQSSRRELIIRIQRYTIDVADKDAASVLFNSLLKFTYTQRQ